MFSLSTLKSVRETMKWCAFLVNDVQLFHSGELSYQDIG